MTNADQKFDDLYSRNYPYARVTSLPSNNVFLRYRGKLTFVVPGIPLLEEQVLVDNQDWKVYDEEFLTVVSAQTLPPMPIPGKTEFDTKRVRTSGHNRMGTEISLDDFPPPPRPSLASVR